MKEAYIEGVASHDGPESCVGPRDEGARSAPARAVAHSRTLERGTPRPRDGRRLRRAIDAGKGPSGALTTAARGELVRLRRDNRWLMMEREILKKAALFLREGEPVTCEIIDAEKALHPVAVLCAALEISRSGDNVWKGRPAPARTKADMQLGVEIAAVHHRSRRTCGSPRVHSELRAKGLHVGKKRVARVMREDGLAAAASIGDYIEWSCNPQRWHSPLGYVSPIEFELRCQTAAITAK